MLILQTLQVLSIAHAENSVTARAAEVAELTAKPNSSSTGVVNHLVVTALAKLEHSSMGSLVGMEDGGNEASVDSSLHVEEIGPEGRPAEATLHGRSTHEAELGNAQQIFSPIKLIRREDRRALAYQATEAELSPVSEASFLDASVEESVAHGERSVEADLQDETNFYANYAGNREGCKVGQWSEWGACSKTCSSGTRHRERQIESPPGTPCICGQTCVIADHNEACNKICCAGDYECKAKARKAASKKSTTKKEKTEDKKEEKKGGVPVAVFAVGGLVVVAGIGGVMYFLMKGPAEDEKGKKGKKKHRR